MGSQKTTLKDMAESIGHANSATPSDVLAVWDAMEREIVRALENGRRVALGNLGTLRLEVGTKQGKSTARSITSKDVEAKGVTFQPSKQLDRVLADLTFECDGIVAHPLSGARTEEALTEHFATHQYISARTYATLTHCSESTARRRIAAQQADEFYCRAGVSVLYNDTTEEALREDARANAIQSVRMQAAIELVASLENMEASKEEIAQAVAVIARQNNMTVEDLKPYYDAEFEAAVVRSVLTSKVMKLIRDSAEITQK
jgi:predicted histone-like DNA-binding protein